MQKLIPIILIFGITWLACSNHKAAYSDQSGFIELDNTSHYYNLTGTGDTLVILHGGPGLSHHYLKPQLDSLLSNHFTLLYYDQRGSGWTGGEQDSSRLNIETFVHDLEGIRKHFKMEEFNLLGHSFGGILAMYYSIEYPRNVNSIVLVDPDAASYELRTPYQIKTIDARLSDHHLAILDSLEQTTEFNNFNPKSWELYYKTYLTSYFANPEDANKIYLGFDSITIPKIDRTNSIVRGNLGNYDIHHELSKIQSRTLIMQGDKSVFSIEGAQAIHEGIPISELHIFEDCGHFEYIENPEKFKNLVLEFYK